jgi:hypothetical protein
MHIQMFVVMVSSALAALASFLRGPNAYLDPGSGSYLLQLLIAGILGSLFVVRASWDRIKSFFGNMFSRNKDDAPDDRG